MNTIFFPYHLAGNPYCDLVVEMLKDKGINVFKLSDSLKKPFKIFLKVKIINFNFYENFDNSLSPIKAFLFFEMKKLFIDFCKICNMKIIYTMHNKQQHDAKYKRYNQVLIKKLLDKSDVIISLCKEGRDIILEQYGQEYFRKIKIIKHPMYNVSIDLDSDRKVAELVEQLDVKNKMLCVFTGTISPYKNVEYVINAANSLRDKRIKFLIAGNASNVTYYEKLRGMVKGDNVVWDNRYIPEEQLQTYILAADILLFPYNKISSLNSGSVILGLSYGKTCVVPLIGTVKDIINKECIFSYDYNYEDEHCEQFVSEINRAYDIYEHDKERLLEMGKKLNEELIRDYTSKSIGEEYQELYNTLSNERNNR